MSETAENFAIAEDSVSNEIIGIFLGIKYSQLCRTNADAHDTKNNERGRMPSDVYFPLDVSA
jgi:hypothetical protein